MRRLPALFLISCAIAVAAWSCDDDDDDRDRPARTDPAARRPPSTIRIAYHRSGHRHRAAGAGHVKSPIEMSGRANVFEGALTIDALGDAAAPSCARATYRRRPAPARRARGRASSPSTRPDTDTPITLRAYTFSAEDGSMQDVVERSVTLSSEDPAIVINAPDARPR